MSPVESRSRPGSDGVPLDEELVARVRAGDPALFEVLMRRHNGRLYRAVRSVLADEAEVEDVMQQAYVQAYAGLESFAGRASFSTWLARIGVNEALGRLRKRHRLVPLDEVPDRAEAWMEAPPTPEDAAAAREAARLVERAIDRLATIHRTVLMLRDVEQLSTAEVAAVLEVSEDAVKVRLHRARQALRDVLAADVGDAAREAFPFPAPRCDRVVGAVMARIMGAGPGPGPGPRGGAA
jgi:RNA polymerase sigma-70 factor (ECF subfamily)